MKILVINTGSSSIKYQLFDFLEENQELICQGLVEKIGESTSFLTHKGSLSSQEYSHEETILNHREGLIRISKVLIDKDYPFAVIKVINLNINNFINKDLTCNSVDVRINIPDWIKL